MCGIVGVGAIAMLQNRTWLDIGRDLMTHRGPDDSGLWWSDDGCVGLAQRRLSIIDLSPAGHQPMHDASTSLSIVFNGEIYNYLDLRDDLIAKGHIFQTHSDTEVILKAYSEWGAECLRRLNGMFAFAIYDPRNKELFLARDRAGEKPLFFYVKNDEIRFASELKALLADKKIPRHVDSNSLDCYLAMGYVPSEYCILQGFNKLPPAHALRFDLQKGQTKVWRYWQPPDFVITDHPLDENSLLDELEVLLEDAVCRQMIADVPVGVLLSGGVDSSLITAMAARGSSQIKTFTIGFPGHGALDETKHAQLIAQYFGTQHTELMAEVPTPNLLSVLARQFDEPIVDSSMIPTFLVSQMVSQYCAVALGGDGGDELFGGYSHYSQLLGMREKLIKIPMNLRVAVSNAAEKILPIGLKGRNYLQRLGWEVTKGLPLQSSCFDEITRRNLLSKNSNWKPKATSIFEGFCPNQADFLQRATRMDFQNYLAEDVLVKVDRASMLNSLEMRSPFLDYRLVEFAFSKVPSSLKANSNEKKILLKRLTERVLPSDFDRERKQGFSIPLNEWLKSGAFRELFNDLLLDPRSSFDCKVSANLLRGLDKGRKNGERLFALAMFELWRREYDASVF